jgi:hypothetical protein
MVAFLVFLEDTWILHVPPVENLSFQLTLTAPVGDYCKGAKHFFQAVCEYSPSRVKLTHEKHVFCM